MKTAEGIPRPCSEKLRYVKEEKLVLSSTFSFAKTEQRQLTGGLNVDDCCKSNAKKRIGRIYLYHPLLCWGRNEAIPTYLAEEERGPVPAHPFGFVCVCVFSH